MIGVEEIAAATSANDDDSDAGLTHTQIFEKLGANSEHVEAVATDRALKAIGVLFWGDPNRFPKLSDLMATGDPGQLTTLGTLAGCFIDGLAAGLRLRQGAAEVADELDATAARMRGDAGWTPAITPDAMDALAAKLRKVG